MEKELNFLQSNKLACRLFCMSHWARVLVRIAVWMLLEPTAVSATFTTIHGNLQKNRCRSFFPHFLVYFYAHSHVTNHWYWYWVSYLPCLTISVISGSYFYLSASVCFLFTTTITWGQSALSHCGIRIVTYLSVSQLLIGSNIKKREATKGQQEEAG